MNSLDDQLRGLLGQAGPPPDRFEGDITSVHRTVRRRRTTRRAMATTLSVLAIAGVGIVWKQPPPENDGVVVRGSTTTPSDPTTSTTSTTTSTTSTTTSSTTSTTTRPGPDPSIRDYDLMSATFRPPCPGDDRGVSLTNGHAELPLSSDALPKYVVTLGSVVYADANGDNNEDALVLLRCEFAGASTENYGSLQAVELDADGVLTPVGPTQPLTGVWSAEGGSTTVTVVREVYASGDARCCPSSAVRERWGFEDNRFVVVDSAPTTTPNTP